MKFICEETVDVHSHSILKLDFEDTTTHRTDDQLYIGQAATDLIASCDELDRHRLKTFYNNCRCFYIAAIQEIRKRCPIDDIVLKQILCIDLQQCLQLQLSELLSRVTFLATRFPYIVKKEEDLEVLKDEVEEFKLQSFDDDLMKLELPSFWHAISKLVDPVSTKLCYTVLPRLMIALLILPHGNADTECVFSRMNLIKTKLRNCMGNKSLNALLNQNCNRTSCCYEFESPQEVTSRVKNSMH